MPGELPQATQVFAAVLLDLIQSWLLIPLPPSFSPNLGGWGWGGVGVWMCKCVSVYVSEWVCVFAVPIYFHFLLSLLFWFMIFSGFLLFPVLEMRTILFSFLLPFVSFCCKHLYFMFAAVSYQMFFRWCSFMYPHWGFWNKPLDLLAFRKERKRRLNHTEG